MIISFLLISAIAPHIFIPMTRLCRGHMKI
jgi:hypothetical protein